jgi:5-methylcytosine-specific restriction endonuclease McrA
VKHRQPDPIGADPDPGDAPGIAPLPSALPTGSRVLLLNATFEPLAVVTAKRAVVLMLTGKAECVEATIDGFFHSENLAIPAPSVMRLSRYVRVPYRRAVPMTRAGVLRRDQRRCAYCGRRADTIDHVVPRSRGGQHSRHAASATPARPTSCSTRSAGASRRPRAPRTGPQAACWCWPWSRSPPGSPGWGSRRPSRYRPSRFGVVHSRV